MNILYPAGLGIAIGLALYTIFPYVLAGLKEVQKEHSWKAFPRFDPAYLASYLIGIIEFALALSLNKNLFQDFISWDMFEAIAVGYALSDLGKRQLKLLALLVKPG